MTERMRSLEGASASAMAGFHGRIALQNQEYLNPNVSVPSTIDRDQRTRVDEKYFAAFENTVNYDAATYWNEQVAQGLVEDNDDEKMTKWKKDVVSKFNAEYAAVKDLPTSFFNNLETYFSYASIDKDNFDETTIDGLLRRYTDDTPETRLIYGGQYGRFGRTVLDLIRSYGRNGNTDIAGMERDADSLAWFVNAVGGNGKLAVHDAIGLAKMFSDPDFPDSVREQMNNGMSEEANELLRHVVEHGGLHFAGQPSLEVEKPEEVPAEPRREFLMEMSEVRERFVQMMRNYDRELLMIPTGQGKTVFSPQIWYNELRNRDKNGELVPGRWDNLIVLQPIQATVPDAAKHVATGLGLSIGKEVVWQHGDARERAKDRRNKNNEVIRVVTEGVGLNWLVNLALPREEQRAAQQKANSRDVSIDPNVKQKLDAWVGPNGVLTVFYDEAQSETKRGALVEFIVRKLQAVDALRDPVTGLSRIRMLFAGATVSAEHAAEKYSIGSPEAVMNLMGETKTPYHIEYKFAPPEKAKGVSIPPNLSSNEIITDATEHLRRVLENDGPQKIIHFLPGKAEIEGVDQNLRDQFPDVMFFYIHGGTTHEEREAINLAILEGKKRIVILGTDAIMTGKTYQGIDMIVQSGLARRTTFDPRIGANRLALEWLSIGEFLQEGGRGGRTNDAEVESTYIPKPKSYDGNNLAKAMLELGLNEITDPETVRTDLCDIVLTLANMGITEIVDPEGLLFTPLGKSKNNNAGEMPDQLKHAKITLKRHGAIDEDGRITEIGRRMDALPVDYHRARALVEAEDRAKNDQLDVYEEVASVVAILEVQGQGFFANLDRPQTEEDRLKFIQIRRNRELFSRQWIDGELRQGTEISNSDYILRLNIFREYDKNTSQLTHDTIKKLFPNKHIVELNKDELANLNEEVAVSQKEWCDTYGISYSAMKKAVDRRNKILEGRPKKGTARIGTKAGVIDKEVTSCMTVGYRDRIAIRRKDKKGNVYWVLFYDPLNNRDIHNDEDLPEGRWDAVAPHIRVSDRVPVRSTVRSDVDYIIADSYSGDPNTTRDHPVYYASVVAEIDEADLQVRQYKR